MNSTFLSYINYASSPNKKWSQLKESVRTAHRRLSEISSKVPFLFNFAPIRRADGDASKGIRIYFLSSLNNSSETTLLYTDVIEDLEDEKQDHLVSVDQPSPVDLSIHTPPDKKSSSSSPENVPLSSSLPTSDLGNSSTKPSSILVPNPVEPLPFDKPLNERIQEISSNPIFDWKPLVKTTFRRFSEVLGICKLTHQEKLQLERKRIMFTGITSYEFHEESRRFVFCSSGSLFYFDDTGIPPYSPIRLETNNFAAKINPQICPSNPDLIAFVSDGDVWVVNVKSALELRVTQAKFNDEKRILSAGLPSYVIQEEFRRYIGFWWRPNISSEQSKDDIVRYNILYEEIDETDVEVVKIACWDGSVEEYRFPRPGTPNALSTLRLASFTVDKRSNEMTETSTIKMTNLYSLYPDYEYLVRSGWLSHDAYWVQLLNRKQNNIILALISISDSFPAQIIYEENASPHWINVTDILHFFKLEDQQNLKPGSELTFLWASEETGFRHLYSVTVHLKSTCEKSVLLTNDDNSRGSGGPNDQNLIEIEHYQQLDLSIEEKIEPRSAYSSVIKKSQLTFGNWEVNDRDVWIDESKKLIYFVGLKESPLERHLYVISIDSEPTNFSPKKLTESNFSHITIAFDKSLSMFVNVQSNISVPPFGYINKMEEQVNEAKDSFGLLSSPAPPKRRAKEEKVKQKTSFPTFKKLGLIVTNILQLNSDPNRRSSRMSPGPSPFDNIGAHLISVEQLDTLPGLSKPDLFTYQLKSTGDLIYGIIFKPEYMESGVKYPCLLDIYGGPEVQVVSNSFKGARHVRRHLLASEGYVVCAFDCRGSSNRGKLFEAHLQNRLGQVEIQDQVEVLTWLSENTGYMDMSRIAVHGWSYGGYLSLMGLAQRPDIFKVAIAGAPVTNWLLYDTGYTERYMDTPCNNRDGYNKGCVSNYINELPNEENRLLIIHGLQDENVHFLHTMELIQNLIKSGKPYQLQVYPSERHSLRNSPSCEHYETVLLSFLQQAL